LKEETYE